ncbi:hypothetical protein M0Q97_03045 [Candidatus Dojkabacteria bacterium]|jgi:hypothetical protein|nr:hypothetical protein [Candidatus Dojkabacteria bacterium]
MISKIFKITESFPGYDYDVETTTWDNIIYFHINDNFKFFFELPNKKNNDTKQKVKIYIKNDWQIFTDDNLNNLIIKTKQIIDERKTA